MTSTINFGMSKRSEKRQEILSEMDLLLSDHGFKRKKRSNDWHKTLNEEITQSINMGIVLYPRTQDINLNPKYGFPSLEKLSDIAQVIKLLSSSNVQDWLDCSASYRARLLPLALAVNGKSAEALTLFPALAKELKGRDQMIPNYQHFTTWFSQKYSNSSEV